MIVAVERDGQQDTLETNHSHTHAQVPSMITAVEMGSKARMVAFCKAIQTMCPVGSYIQPIPGT